jgi:RimJ/RimL family protein N-acetyltransferase
VIHARGVILRLPTLGDYPAWRALREASADYLARVEPDWQPPVDEESFARQVAEAEAVARESRGYSFLICRPNGDLVGGVTLGPFVDRVGLLGTWIGTPFVGRGYAVRAVGVVLDIAFETLGLNSVAASVLPDNDHSIRVLEHFGFEHDPDRNIVLRVADAPRWHLVYVGSRNDWNQSQRRRREGLHRKVA